MQRWGSPDAYPAGARPPGIEPAKRAALEAAPKVIRLDGRVLPIRPRSVPVAGR